MALRLRCLVTVYGPGCLPGHRDYLKRHDSLGFDAGRLLCPVVPRERSEGLARPPPAVSDVHAARDRGAWRIGFDSPPPPVDRAAWRIRAHAGASPAASPPYSCIAALRFGTSASASTSCGCRACTGFPPAVWSPSLSGWLPTTPPQGGSHMAATIAPAPKRHQRNLLITLAAAARKADLAARHYRIPPSGDMPRKPTSAASGRLSGSDGRCATARIIVSSARVTRCRARRGSPRAGRSGRSRRPSAAPASRCRVRTLAPPQCSRGRTVRRDWPGHSRPLPARGHGVSDAYDERLAANNRLPARRRQGRARGVEAHRWSRGRSAPPRSAASRCGSHMFRRRRARSPRWARRSKRPPTSVTPAGKPNACASRTPYGRSVTLDEAPITGLRLNDMSHLCSGVETHRGTRSFADTRCHS